MESSALCFRFPEPKHAHNNSTFLSLIFWQIITYLYLLPCPTEGGAYHAGRSPGHSDWTRQSCLFFQAAGWKSCSKWVFSLFLWGTFFGMFYGLISSMIVSLRDHVTPGGYWAASLKHCSIPSASPASTQPIKQDCHDGTVLHVLCCGAVASSVSFFAGGGDERWQRISTTLLVGNSQLFSVQCLALPDLSLFTGYEMLWNNMGLLTIFFCTWVKHHTRSR